MQIDESVIQPGMLSMRTRFDDYTGLFVMHCHRLNHEDNGLMALINVIPAVSTYAVAIPGAPGKPAQVRVYDGNGDRLVATVTPFPGFEGSVSVAMGDVDDDGALDLIVGAGKGHAPEVVVYAAMACGQEGRVRHRTRAFPALRGRGTRRRQRGCGADRRDERRQHHRRVGPRHPERGQGLRLRAADFARDSAGAVRHVQPLRRRPVGCEPRHGLRRLRDGPQQHRHRARRRAARPRSRSSPSRC